ncbi:TIGR03089 family protein [Angustibacter sp. McL0619]|uniref:TIGR03089 family protein n=1 Tax=Angustibacter sp. McL0619 TaxID=3415676 RepID=UPI003CF373D2
MEGTRPEALAADLARRDASSPRLTWYDEPTGERIELSGRVLANWTAKTANLLVDELGLQTGDRVRLDLPAHWRSVYWALATWSAGGVLTLGRPDDTTPPVVLVTDRPAGPTATAGPLAVAVSLAALARRWAGADPLPAGWTDEAAEVMLQADVFDLDDEAPVLVAMDPDGQSWDAARLVAAARELASAQSWTAGSRIGLALGPAEGSDRAVRCWWLLTCSLAAWSVQGSLVAVSGELSPDALDARWASERVTSVAAPAGRPAARS